MDIC